MRSYFGLFLFFLLLPVLTFAQPEKGTNEYCFRCHSMESLNYRDESTGMIQNLTVKPHDFKESTHGFFYCIDCHSEGYEEFPHPDNLENKKVYCLDCHESSGPHQEFIQFEEIENAFEESVHKTRLGDKFTCFDCHDPHTFQLTARVSEDIKKTVLYDNHICVECHGDAGKINVMSDRVIAGLSEAHEWLPHQQLHWKNVRCIDCHTSGEETGVAHNILPKEEAVRNCVDCHSTNTMLAQTLYKFQAQQERNRQGFFNGVILNNSYIVGATRNYYLNLLSFVIFGGMLIALSIHGYFYAGSRKRKHVGPGKGKEYFYPLWLRFWHWLNALLFILLIISGITLQYAGVDDDPFLRFDAAITLHNTAGITLTINYLFFFIGNIITGNYKQYIPVFRGLFRRLFLQGKFYLIGIFRNEPHPFETTRERKFNPLQRITYLNIMYGLMPVIIITGWGLLFPETLAERFLGESGLFLTAVAHTITGFFLSMFMFGHMYLGTTGATAMANYKAMFTGWHEIHDEH